MFSLNSCTVLDAMRRPIWVSTKFMPPGVSAFTTTKKKGEVSCKKKEEKYVAKKKEKYVTKVGEETRVKAVRRGLITRYSRTFSAEYYGKNPNKPTNTRRGRLVTGILSNKAVLPLQR